jgi:peptidoglycan hydrolase-like protein with peptidoglycan-binding domain
LIVDGVEGQKTRAAVEAFQGACGLTIDSVLGPKTIAALRATLASAQ